MNNIRDLKTSTGVMFFIKKKFLAYFSIFTIVLGSTLGFNTAYAADGDAVGVADSTTTVNASTTNIDQSDLTLETNENSATSFTLTGDINVDTITFEDSDTVASAIAVSSDITVDETIIMPDQGTGATTYTFTVADSKTMTIGGSVTEGTNANLIFILANGGMTFNGSSAQTIEAAIDSDAGNDGDITISNTAGVTFSDAVGGAGSDELGSVTVASGATATFNGTLDAILVTNNGTLAINNAIDAPSLASVVMNASDSVLNFNSASTRDLDMIVTAATDGFGTINVIDTSGGAAAAAMVLSGGDIGTTTARVGTLNVGSSTANGALTTIDGDAIFVDALKIEGGDHADEDSIIIAVENITATDGITLTAADAGDAELNTATAAVTITGTVDSGSGTDGAGTTLIDADIGTTFANNVGATTAIESMTIADSIQVDLDGVTNAIESVVITDAGVLEFDAAADQTFTGAITFAADNDGTIINANTDGELTVDGAIGTATIGATEITLNDGAITKFNSAVFALTLDIDTTATTTTFEVAGSEIGDTGGNAGALQIVAGSVIELGTAIGDGSTVFDTQTVSANDAGVLIAGDFTVKPSANFTSGTIVLIQGDAANVTAAEKADILVQNTALTTFTVDDGGGTATHDIGITATAKNDSTTASELSVTTNDAKGLRQAMAAVANDSAALTALNNAMVGINGQTSTADTDMAKQVAPQTDLISGSSFAAQGVTSSVQGIMSNRMASLRSGDAYFGTGVAAGGMSAQSGFIQVFGSETDQDSTKVGSGTQAGYDASTQGVAIGFDGVTDDGMTIGVSVSTANTDVDGKGTGKSTNSIDTYSASLYMDTATENGYFEGSLTFGVNENSTSRKVNTAGLDRTYTGSYDSNTISLNLGAGVPTEVGAGYLTPFGGLTVTSMDIDAYTEKSAVANDALRLKVAQDEVNSMIGTVGLKFHGEMSNGGMPMISLAINNEFGDSTIDSTNTFQGGGTAFKTSTAVEELSATLGLGYSYGSDAASIEFAYEADANDDEYLSHYGSVKIVSKF